MNIAIVGEGPIGAIVCIFFIYYKLNFQLDDLNIYFYKSRNTFKRRHIVKINKNVLQDIEKLIDSCVDCLTVNNNNQIIDLSIRCLEFLLHKNINNTYVNIIEKKFTEKDNIENIYQNIFLCDGFASNNRLFYVYNNIKYKPLRMVFTSPVLILYGNLDLSDAPINPTCINNTVVKKQYFSPELLTYGIEMNLLVAFISIIYNINFKYNTFSKFLPDSKMRESNLWVEGYNNYQNFLDIFTATIEYLNNLDDNVVLSIFNETNVFISPDVSLVLKNKNMIPDIFDKYKNFLKQELTKIDSVDKPFIIHNVMPNCTTFGVILDDSVETLVFARTNPEMGYTSWLIGDSANSYPPGVSLQNGIKDVFTLVPIFIKTNFLPDTDVPLLNNELFNCQNSKYVFNQTPICKTLSEFKFSGGYLFDDEANKNELPISQVIEKIQGKICSDDGLVNIYNNYQLNNFFTNLIDYICKNNPLVTTGGKNKNKNKNKNKTNKKNKHKKNKNKKTRSNNKR